MNKKIKYILHIKKELCILFDIVNNISKLLELISYFHMPIPM